MNEENLHVLGNYGQCRLDVCMCIDAKNPRFGGAWGGLSCPDWVPLGPINWEQMIEHAKENYKSGKETHIRSL
jgi:hypothetical protein